jgi:membrane protein YqaA with SNARE-associated domain
MIGKVVLLPVVLVKGVVGLAVGILGFVMSGLMGVVRFVLNHVLGTLFGAIVGFMLGRKHVGIKLFPDHRKKK